MLNMQPLSKEALKGLERDLVEFIRSQVASHNKDGILIGLSGGIDSSVCAALAVKAIGADKIRAYILPDQDSDPQSAEDAAFIAGHLGIGNVTQRDITPILSALGSYDLFADLYAVGRESRGELIARMKKELAEANSADEELLVSHRRNGNEILRKVKALWNSKTRTRMVLLYYYAELHNLLVLGTTNKTEYMLGWFTKHGDGAVDIEPLVSLYKTRVYELAEHLRIPDAIVQKQPSGDILPGITDEDGIGISYRDTDKTLLGLEREMSSANISRETNVPLQTLNYIKTLIDTSVYTRSAAILFSDIKFEGA